MRGAKGRAMTVTTDQILAALLDAAQTLSPAEQRDPDKIAEYAKRTTLRDLADAMRDRINRGSMTTYCGFYDAWFAPSHYVDCKIRIELRSLDAKCPTCRKRGVRGCDECDGLGFVDARYVDENGYWTAEQRRVMRSLAEETMAGDHV